MPGKDPGGIIVTMLLGIVGAVLGGYAGRALGMYGPADSAGIFMSILGAIVVLLDVSDGGRPAENHLNCVRFRAAVLRISAVRSALANREPTHPPTYAPGRPSYPRYVSPASRWALTTSGFSVMPSPGLSVTWMNPSLMYGTVEHST